ncbi:hypothetical protein [Streptomyces aidingensis]|uniref:hypothetical protein n=1 Tax=Streptomyces aidingensis TaxID=910347 RepID=UPI001114B00E|nr:hypothetical protein [Streptomyces aidingensis]
MAEDAEWQGTRAVYDRLVPRLVGVHRTEPRPVPREFAVPPVIRVTGGRAAGKSRLIEILRDGYDRRLAVAHADLADPFFGHLGLSGSGHRTRETATDADDGTAGTAGTAGAEASPAPPGPPPGPPGAAGELPEPVDTLALSRLLALLSYQLAARTEGPGRPVTCHRLTLGLLLLTAWRPDEEGTDPAEAREHLRTFIASWYAGRRGTGFDFDAWLQHAVAQLLALLGFPLPEDLAGMLLTTARQLRPGTRSGRAALRWWEENVTGRGGDGFSRLFEFVNAFRQRGEADRHEGRLLLVAALLADVDAQRGPWQSFSRTPPPLLLLDNVHTPRGEHLLDLLLTAYDRGARPAPGRGGRGTAFRPVIVTTALGDPAAHRSCDAVRDATVAWQPPGPENLSATAWLLPLGIPGMNQDDARRLFGVAAWSAALAWPVRRLSRGREGIVRELAGPVSRAAASGTPHSGSALLRLPAAGGGGRTLGEALLDRLLPDPVLQDELALLAPALNKQAAVWLMKAVTPPDRPAAKYTVAARLEAVTAELDGGHWQRGTRPWPWPAGEPGGADGVPFLTDPALRILLLHRLRTRLAGQWGTVQRRLRTFHNTAHLDEGAPGHGLAYLHHTLALGRLEPVVRCLHHRLPDMTAAEWLSWVNIICAAPHPPAGGPAAEPAAAGAARTPCPACVADPGTGIHDAITWLVSGVWRLSDPLAPVPSSAELLQVSGALVELQATRQGDAAFLTAATRWSGLLGRGTQAPELTDPPGEERP